VGVAYGHGYYIDEAQAAVLVHNRGDDGPYGTVFRDRGYVFQIYSNDHGPPHGHLKGEGYDIQLGQNGKPLDPDITLTRGQQQIVDDHIGEIRLSIGDSMKAYKANGGC
jgi:hypothetical protein